ncbi:MAG: peptidylprolyl isomerase [Gammaproteobacteria bacterium]|nr:peptidylprolyl isomerase [Gammaproteobacteria bacterium]
MKKIVKTFAYLVALSVAGLVGAYIAGGGSGTAGLPAAAVDVPAAEAPATAAVAPASARTIGFEDIARILDPLPVAQRATVTADEASFKRFVEAEAALGSMLAAARANRIDENPVVVLLMRRQAERVLVDAYLRELARVNLGPDYPSVEQLRTFYADNLERFKLPERVPVWQIFWSLAEDADAAAVTAATARAAAVLKDLRAGKIAYADAAARYSEHAQSRFAGGYMGILSVTDLLPEVRAAVADLKEDAVSDVIRTGSGLHIIKRGPLLAGQQLAFEEVQAQARELLVNEAANRLRESVVAKAREQYPLSYDTTALEQWRAKLRPPPEARADGG